jgi:outer membrane protein OmpA-like peptidoglycan-associated protein
LKEVNLACNTLLPAEPGIDAPAALRGAGPSSRHAEAPAAMREPLTGVHEFTVLYAFDDDYLDYAGNRVATDAADYAKRIAASSVKVAGYRASVVLSNGTSLVERTGLAEKRAKNITAILHGLGVANVAESSKPDPETGDGSRRVTILVSP